MIRSTLLAVFLLLGAPLAQSQVTASLVATTRSVQPGGAVTVALRLDHQAGWHSYWLNAGTGYPTSLEWNLPKGWSASKIEWPVPEVIKDSSGAVTGNGYSGLLYLPVMLSAPVSALSGQTTLNATANWLMCADICVPGSAPVSLTLPISAKTPEPNPSVLAELNRMPRTEDAPADWKVSASRQGKTVVLRIDADGGWQKADEAWQTPHFFGVDAFIAYDGHQSQTGRRGLTLTLPVADDAPVDTQRLVGVLSYLDAERVHRGLRIDLPLTPAAPASAAAALSVTRSDSAGAALWITVSAALLGGLILNLMPCVFPVLGLKILGFVQESGASRRRVTLHGVTFTFGVLLSFWMLAAALAALRAGGLELGWGFQLQSAPFVFVLTVVMLAFALSLSGVFEFGLRATGMGNSLYSRQGYWGSFFTGILATVVATPCSAPFLAPALAAAVSLPGPHALLVLSAIGVGLSAPYLLLSIFPRALRVLPKPGRWMETFRQLMAFPLFGTAAYLVWVLAGQVDENGLLMILLALTLIAMGLWLYGRDSRSRASVGRARVSMASACAIMASGLYLGWPRAPASADIKWEPWSEQRVAELRTSQRPIYVDFTARWCATCQANKRIVFSSAEVKRQFHTLAVVTLEADWTNSDPRITAELARWNRAAVPLDLLYLPGETAPRVLPQILTPRVVVNALQQDRPHG